MAKAIRELPTERNFFDLPGTTTSVSWEPPKSISYEEWRIHGLRVKQLADFSKFAIGDWLCFGESKFGEAYSQAASETGINEERLMQLKFVSSRIEILTRVKEISLSHHRIVATARKLTTQEERSTWLQRALANNWTTRELEEALKDRTAESEASSEVSEDEVCSCCHSNKATRKVCESCAEKIA